MTDQTGQGTTLRVVRAWDPAILWPDDRKAQEKQAQTYHRERVFESLKFLPGARPMVFVTRRLRRSEMRDVECMTSMPYRYEAGFVIGVERVEMPDGSVKRPANGKRWTEDELDEHFDNPTVNDIGSVVVERSNCPLDLKPRFVEPPSSLDALAAWLYRSAAQSPVDASQSKSAPAEQSGT
jgi:hypothetical protein